MKKLLMMTICLSLFAISLSLLQISCSKTEAQISTNNTTAVNKILYKESFNVGGVITFRYSIMNYDGSGVQHLNIPFPPGFGASSGHASLSPDAKKMFFSGFENPSIGNGFYSCDTSGTNFTRIANCDPTVFDAFVCGAY